MAGVAHMPWGRFLLWNAAGGICWALLIGLVAYYAGQAAVDAISKYGLIAGAVLVVLVAGGFLALHLWKKRMLRTEPEL
jgi:membrane protein DedA with SNARE-associated domain